MFLFKSNMTQAKDTKICTVVKAKKMVGNYKNIPVHNSLFIHSFSVILNFSRPLLYTDIGLISVR